MTDPRITGLLRNRALAQHVGDLNVVHACTVELANLGYHDDAPTLEPPIEDTAAAQLPENTAAPRAARW